MCESAVQRKNVVARKFEILAGIALASIVVSAASRSLAQPRTASCSLRPHLNTPSGDAKRLFCESGQRQGAESCQVAVKHTRISLECAAPTKVIYLKESYPNMPQCTAQ